MIMIAMIGLREVFVVPLMTMVHFLSTYQGSWFEILCACDGIFVHCEAAQPLQVMSTCPGRDAMSLFFAICDASSFGRESGNIIQVVVGCAPFHAVGLKKNAGQLQNKSYCRGLNK